MTAHRNDPDHVLETDLLHGVRLVETLQFNAQRIRRSADIAESHTFDVTALIVPSPNRRPDPERYESR